MRRSSKTFLLGTGIAVAVWLVGSANVYRLRQHELAVQTKCNNEVTDPVLVTFLAAPNGKYPTWADVTADPAYQRLTTTDREFARERYFQIVVVPRVPPSDLGAVRAEFDADTDPTGGREHHVILDVTPSQLSSAYRAIRQADAVGDNVRAKRIADYIRSLEPALAKASSAGDANNESSDSHSGAAACDGATLTTLGSLEGSQAKLGAAYSVRISAERWPAPAAIGIFVLSALPWLWYALLRRIAELRAAIAGRPPDG